MAAILKKVVLTVVGLVAAFVFVANYSEVSQNYKCTGTMTPKWANHSGTLHLLLTKYQWWVKLWSESEGHLFVEHPDLGLVYLSDLDWSSVAVFIEDRGPSTTNGKFSLPSQRLTIEIVDGVNFDGYCEKL